MSLFYKLAKELAVNEAQITAAVALLDAGATVPFIARYRKEVTQGLDDTQLRQLEERLVYCRELNDRRQAILDSIVAQGKLTDELKKQLEAVETKAALEDLYLPYKPKRRTKAAIAKEAGLEPLAQALLSNPSLDPEEIAKDYLTAEHKIERLAEALEGARHILMEQFSEQASLIAELRQFVFEHAELVSVVKKDKEKVGEKFKDYFAYREAVKKIPSHRALALFRGSEEEVLRMSLSFPENSSGDAQCVSSIANAVGVSSKNRPADAWLWETVLWTWELKLKPKIEVDVLMSLREAAEKEAIRVFKDNLKNLLMAAPAGKQVTLGLDPGLRTGVKTVVVDDTGKLLMHTVIYPHVPQCQWEEAIQILQTLIKQYQVTLVSIGNGTGSRETEKLVSEIKKRYPDYSFVSAVVSEAGASVYSASALAAKEFPDLDVSYRGAVSIARRVQDPLAELVKIDPKSIGVGQYQHDVNQSALQRGLSAVLEDCVNAVGADVNTASVPLLKSIAGLNESIAENIVQYREQHGRFTRRAELKKVPRLGEKTYEQAIGFLRILEGADPLDASAVHPECYPVVDKILEKTRLSLCELMGNSQLLQSLNAKEFIDDRFGLITVNDILEELKKPGRDPRPEFKTASFQEGIETLADLTVGLSLEGVVTNVTNFGAFVDIGVHQDGLVHISQLADTFVSDPHQVVKVGQIVTVRVIEVEPERKRIALSMKSGDPKKASAKLSDRSAQKASPATSSATKPTGQFGALLRDALK